MPSEEFKKCSKKCVGMVLKRFNGDYLKVRSYDYNKTYAMEVQKVDDNNTPVGNIESLHIIDAVALIEDNIKNGAFDMEDESLDDDNVVNNEDESSCIIL